MTHITPTDHMVADAADAVEAIDRMLQQYERDMDLQQHDNLQLAALATNVNVIFPARKRAWLVLRARRAVAHLRQLHEEQRDA